jgi:ABC-2 type transport system ATP-binding protein
VLADAAELGRLERALAALPGVAAVEAEPREARLTALPRPGADLYGAVTELAARERFDLHEVRLEAGRLDEVFRSITTAPGGTS